MGRVVRLVLLAALLGSTLVAQSASIAQVERVRETRLLDSVSKSLVQTRSAPDSNSRSDRSLQLPFLFSCTSNQSCYPVDPPLVDVSSKLISCDTDSGQCSCSDCFVLVNDSCQINAPCRGFDNVSRECTDNRRSQKTTLLLSVFLSSLGAANFYIESYVLGAVQLGLFVLLLVLACGLGCVPACCYIYDEDELEDVLENSGCLCLIVLVFVLVVLLAVLVCAWWVADLTVFVQNGRSSGSGCTLLADL